MTGYAQAKCSTANTSGCDDITVQTADDNAIWIIHGVCTETSASRLCRWVGKHGRETHRRHVTKSRPAWWNSTTAKSRTLLRYCHGSLELYKCLRNVVTPLDTTLSGLIRCINPISRIFVALLRIIASICLVDHGDAWDLSLLLW